MQRLRPFGFFALVAVVLAGCGTVASTLLPGSGSQATTEYAPPCPNGGIPTTAYCTTPVQTAAGTTFVHMKTVPDAIILGGGNELLTPSQTPKISMQEAEQAALAVAKTHFPTAQIVEAVLVDNVSNTGTATAAQGSLQWIINVTPPGNIPGFYAYGPNTGAGQTNTTTPSPEPPGTTPAPPPNIKYVIVGVNALTGKVDGAVTIE